VLGVFKIKSECYESLQIALRELIEELSLIEAIQVDDIEYHIIFWLGGDLKFLALALGNYLNI
jgi:hypothetical protein